MSEAKCGSLPTNLQNLFDMRDCSAEHRGKHHFEVKTSTNKQMCISMIDEKCGT